MELIKANVRRYKRTQTIRNRNLGKIEKRVWLKDSIIYASVQNWLSINIKKWVYKGI